MGKLQIRLKEQTDNNAKQAKEFGESLKKMQDISGQLQKSLDKITTQNTDSLKQLNAAKELERQLNEARKKSGKTGFVVMTVIAAILLVVLLVVIM